MSEMYPEVREALARYIAAMADDELVIGYRDTEWTGVAPMLEEDLAFSSIGLDEIGHARTFYGLLHDLTGTRIDYRARAPHEYLHAQYLERATAPRYDPAGHHEGGSDFVTAAVRQFLYDRFDAARLDALGASLWEPLAQATDKIRREEKYHLLHGQTWIDRLAESGPESRERLERTLERDWPDALGLFEPVEGEQLLVANGMVSAPPAGLRDRWLDALAPTFARHGLPLPAERADGAWALTVEPRTGGRRGLHTPDWNRLWDDMTSVYRLDPAATW